MNYQVAVEYLESLHKFPGVSKFDRVQILIEKLSIQYKDIKFIHVTGTNGKGSTCAMIESVLRQAGYKTGLFTSPHLFKYNERIKINNQDISDQDFIKCIEQLNQVIEKVTKEDATLTPCLFEAVWTMALQVFEDQAIDYAIIETGIGGSYDPTNIIDSDISVITNIDLEHTELLGNTKAAIAKDKSGIIKPNSICITTEQVIEALEVIAATAQYNKAKLIHLQESYQGKLRLIGEHQAFNAAIAYEIGRQLKINETDIIIGLAQANWPLRLEKTGENPSFIIDCAHNLHGIKSIIKTIQKEFKEQKKILILGCSNDKPYQAMSSLLAELSNTIITTQAQYKSISSNIISEHLKEQFSQKHIHTTNSVKQAINKALKLSKKDDLILVLGGLYLAAEAKQVID